MKLFASGNTETENNENVISEEIQMPRQSRPGFPNPQPPRPNQPRPEQQRPNPQRPSPQRPDQPQPLPGGMRRPASAPPQSAPRKGNTALRIDRGAIDSCMFNFTYIWLKNGREFWFFPTYLGRSSIAGFRWQFGRWFYIGFDLDSIEFFSCGGF